MLDPRTVALIGIAQEKRLWMAYGLVLTENKRMPGICENTGFTIRQLPDGESRVELILRRPPLDPDPGRHYTVSS